MQNIVLKNYCTADKIASDPLCYDWAKSNPDSTARYYFCQQRFRDPLCDESFVEKESHEISIFALFILVIIINAIILLIILRKNKDKEKYLSNL